MNPLLNDIIRTGTGGANLLWEDQLIMRLNRITILGGINMIIGIIFFTLFDYPQFLPECIACIFVFIIILTLNKYRHYLWGVYAFYIFGFIFLAVFSLRMGQHSYMILFFFPVIISMVQLLGRTETMKHLIVLSANCILSISIVAIGYQREWLSSNLEMYDFNILSTLNIILSFVSTILFTLFIVRDFLHQEKIISDMLKDKDILIAEIFHRVKNNLNVVTSLLNLQKNNTDSIEVQNALDECRSRIFSMALVHENLFNDKEIGLDFKKYIDRLVRDIELTFGVNGETVIELYTENVVIELEKALPCGMILNELITNAHKYARTNNGPLKISVALKKVGDKIELIVRDNGPGIEQAQLLQNNSLGFILIDSLCDQLAGESFKTNDGGFHYKMIF